MKRILDDNFIRNEVLQDIPMYMQAKGFDVSYVISFNELLNLRDKLGKKYTSKKYINKRNNAIKYLLAYKYLRYGVDRDENTYYVSITQEGLNACNSEYFYYEYKKFKRERVNNRYTIAFGVITAGGVLFAILKDTLLSVGTAKQEMRIIIEQQPKTLPQSLDSTRKLHAPIQVDASENNRKKH